MPLALSRVLRAYTPHLHPRTHSWRNVSQHFRANSSLSQSESLPDIDVRPLIAPCFPSLAENLYWTKQASRLVVNLTEEPKPLPLPSTLKFGHTFVSHILFGVADER